MTLSRIAAAMAAGLLAVGPAAAERPASAVSANQALERSGERLAVEDEECRSRGRMIVVCARDNASDRYRLPFATVTPGDPDSESVMAERVRLQANPGTCQSWAFVRAGCGMVGVSAGIGGGGTFVSGGLRRSD